METPAPRPCKKALITGITGQDGSYLAELLFAKDAAVAPLSNYLHAEPTTLPEPIEMALQQVR